MKHATDELVNEARKAKAEEEEEKVVVDKKPVKSIAQVGVLIAYNAQVIEYSKSTSKHQR